MAGLKDDQLQRLAERIHKFETQKGSSKGGGLDIQQYTQGKAKNIEELKKLIQDEYVTKVEKELSDGGLSMDSLSEQVLFELIDYKFNTGRSTRDLLTYASGESTIDELKGNTPKKDISKAAELTIEDIYKAKDDAYKTTSGYTLENPHPSYESSWKFRIGSTQEGHDDFSKPWSDYSNDAKKVSKNKTNNTEVKKPTELNNKQSNNMDINKFIELYKKWDSSADPDNALTPEETEEFTQFIIDNFEGSNLTPLKKIEGEDVLKEISNYVGSDIFKAQVENAKNKGELSEVSELLLKEKSAKDLADKEKLDSYKKEVAARQELKTDVQKKTADAYNVAKVGVDTAKILESYRQIKAGKEAQRSLESSRPQMPTLRESEDLASATQRAQARANQGLTDRALSAIRQQDIDDYSAQQAAIKSAAAGQSGVYGSLMSKGGVDALKRNILLGQADQAAQAQNEMQASQLAQARANELSTNQQLGLRFGYQPQLEEWQLSKVGAREAERAGRLNLARQQQVLPYTLGNLANQYYRRDEQTAPSLTGYDPLSTQKAQQTLAQAQKKVNESNSLNLFNQKKDDVNKALAFNNANIYKALATPRIDNTKNINSYLQSDEAYPSFMSSTNDEETNSTGSSYNFGPIV